MGDYSLFKIPGLVWTLWPDSCQVTAGSELLWLSMLIFREEARGAKTFTEACQVEPPQVQPVDGRVLPSCSHQPGEELQAGGRTPEQRNLECWVREYAVEYRLDNRPLQPSTEGIPLLK